MILKSKKKRVMLNELFLPLQSFCWIGIRVWIRVKPQSAKAASGQLEHNGGKYFLKLHFLLPPSKSVHEKSPSENVHENLPILKKSVH